MRLHFNWKMALFVVICLPITIAAGFWQLDRANEKKTMQAAHSALVGEKPIALERLAAAQWQDYRNVTARGHFIDKVILVDNQIYKGRFGYEVVQPLQLDNGNVLMVSRGWHLGSLDRRVLPDIEPITTAVTVAGYLYRPKPNRMTDHLAAAEGWPKVVQGANVENMYSALGIDGKMRVDFLLRLATDDGLILTPNWVVITMPPEKHLGYAFQWFAMAALLVVLFLYTSVSRRSSASNSTQKPS
ncbi:Uncharacterised protein [BD1-7 clade bacterium]|uniref:SURF1-like protein n=1 Tax=BD1-7 clade bacterium TaxID=2029982 RepID=A0A5S9QGH9_9GAMM|nr:Uncharacterised protein [BD1-7 clade bacterium]